MVGGVLHNGNEGQIESLALAMIDLDESRFEKTLNQAIIRTGFENTLFEIIYPFFEHIGVLWQAGSINPAQEHFITNLIKQKIYVAIDGLQHVSTVNDSKSFVVFLPEWELHELGMLIYNYFLKKAGFKVTYLGQKVPEQDLLAVCELINPGYLFTSFSSPVEQDQLIGYVDRLSKNFYSQQIFISGHHSRFLEYIVPSNVRVVRNALQFRDEILQGL